MFWKKILIICQIMLFIGFFSSCKHTPSSLQSIALYKIESYANNPKNKVPTVDDYARVGVVGITSENLHRMNIAVSALTAVDVDTKEELQKIADYLFKVPVLENSVVSVAENILEGTVIGSITIIDEGGSAIRAISLSGEGSQKFTVSIDGIVTIATGVSLDYETTQYYFLNMIARNNAGDSVGVELNITVTDYTNPFQIAKLQANKIDADNGFGKAVAVSGDYIIIGAPYQDSDLGNASGCAFLYKKQWDDSLLLIAKLEADDARRYDEFGNAVAISGDYIVVGVPSKDTGGFNTGSAYVFKRNSDNINDVTQIAKLGASDATRKDKFGNAVAIFGDYIVVGAYNKDVNATNTGGAYVFKINSDNVDDVTQIAKIKADDREEYDYFGASVSISGKYIIVGAYGKSVNADYAGSAYVFKRNSDALNDVIQIAKIEANNPVENDYFGASVSISGDYMIVGAESTHNQGSAYVFKRNSDRHNDVMQIAKLQASDVEAKGKFGKSVAISKNYMLIGSECEYSNTDCNSSAYIYKLNSNTNNVTLVDNITESAAHISVKFGNPVAMSGNNIIVSTQREGSAYIFDMEPVNRIYIYNTPLSAVKYDEGFYNVPVYNFNAAIPSEEKITFSLSGLDGDAFTFIEDNLTFDPKANFENPRDEDSHNDYNVTVAASTTQGDITTIKVDVLVEDRVYLDLNKIRADDQSNYNYFAKAVAINEDYILIGASGNTMSGESVGVAYLYKKETNGTILQIAKIEASDVEAKDLFGSSVAMSGDYIVVASPEEDTNGSNAGSVYIFKRNSDTINDITQIAKIQGNDAHENDHFGNSVAISGDTIVVGAQHNDNTGSVYIFKINTDSSNDVIQIAKIKSDNPKASDHFGISVAILGDYIVVGADTVEGVEKGEGRAYLFKRLSDNLNDVSQIAEIKANDPSENALFGYSVMMSGDYILVSGGKGVYLYKRHSDTSNDISQIAKINLYDEKHNNPFKGPIAMSGDKIVVGKYKKLYVYNRNSDNMNDITQIAILQTSDDEQHGGFGDSVAIFNDYIVGGAPYDHRGSAYIFVKDVD